MIDYEKIIPDNYPIQQESSDCENEVEISKPKKTKKNKSKKKMNERDDLSGMFLNMTGKIDFREIFILWILFLFLHTSTFAEHILKKFKGATNENGTMTMKGTIYASLFMVLAILLCTILF